MRKYKPATFQPTVRPDWGGVLSYIPESEKACILEAIIKYPSIECNSPFWLETVKPDLDLQYEEFTRQCEAKSRGVRNRWGKTSITPLVDKNNKCNTDVIVPEGIGIGEEERIKEDKRIEKYNYDTLFFEFWNTYTPVKCDGRVVGKGSKKTSYEKFVKIMKLGVNYEELIAGTRAYIKHCQDNNQFTCGVPVFLNEQRWADDYNTTAINATDNRGKQSEPRSILEENAELALELTAQGDFYGIRNGI